MTNASALALVCAFGSLSCAHIAMAASAATVEFAIGNVSATNAAGVSRALAKGAEVEAGDTVDTGTGRAQLRFTDGAYISLQPGSQFRIDEYAYSGKSDDTERGFFSLIKGGLRTITGLIGRSNRRNYQVRVPVATIGIRGTEYTLAYEGTASGSVGEGVIEVCNAGGCLNVVSGQSYFVSSPELKPVLTATRTSLPPTPPPRENSLPTYTVTNDVNDSGQPAAFGEDLLLFGDQIQGSTGTQGAGPRLPVTTQRVALATVNSTFVTRQSTSDTRLTAADVELGRLVSWADGPGTTNNGTASVTDNHNLGLIAWGRFRNGVLGGDGVTAGTVLTDPDSFHYVVGKPTLPDTMPRSGQFEFGVVGHTTPTTVNSFARFDSASLRADFTAGTVTASVTVIEPLKNIASPEPDKKATLTGNLAINGSLFGGVGRTSGTACTSNCGGDLSGMFAGPNAQFAGFTYDIEGTSFGGVRGAVVLRR